MSELEDRKSDVQHLVDLVRGVGIGPPPEPLYHYTNSTGFNGIIKSNSIWASNIHFLNDESELRHAMQLLRQELDRKLDEASDGFSQRALATCKEKLDGKDYVRLHLASFSQAGDLLSQWRAYCPDGGVSIGFHATALTSERVHEQGFGLFQCIYDPQVQRQIVRGVVESRLDAFHAAREIDMPEKSQALAALLGGLWRDAILVGPLLKHHAFKEEEEWRLVGRPTLNSPLKFRETTSMLLPYVAIELDKEPVAQVVVGPSRHPDLVHYSTTLLLQGRELPFASVVRSEVPFRSLHGR